MCNFLFLSELLSTKIDLTLKRMRNNEYYITKYKALTCLLSNYCLSCRDDDLMRCDVSNVVRQHLGQPMTLRLKHLPGWTPTVGLRPTYFNGVEHKNENICGRWWKKLLSIDFYTYSICINSKERSTFLSDKIWLLCSKTEMPNVNIDTLDLIWEWYSMYFILEHENG